MTYQETPALLLFPHLAEWVTPLPSIKRFYLTPSTALGFLHLEHKDQDLVRTPFADSNWLIDLLRHFH
jgi:hypothetical protein